MDENCEKCTHGTFDVSAAVDRFVKEDKVLGYLAKVVIYCAKCRMPFQFTGLSTDSDMKIPFTNNANVTAFLPIKPIEEDDWIEIQSQLAERDIEEES